MVEKIITGIVLNKFPYEDEHIVKILSEGGNIISLKAKGLGNLTSKNNASLMLFNICEVEYFTSISGMTGRLKTARVLKEFIKDNELSLNVLETIRNIISERVRNTNVTYNTIKNILSSLENNNFSFQKLLALMIITLRNEGYKLVVNSCVKCGTNKNIKGFSIYEGGLICELHEEAKQYEADPSFLRKIIEINSIKNPIECNDLNFSPKEISMLKSMYKNFFENQLGINLYLINKI